MALENWELIILQAALGSLISGVILFVFSIIIAGMSTGDTDTDASIDSDVDFDLDVDMDINLDAGIDLDTGDVDIGTGDIETGHDITNLDHDTAAPILLLLSTFFLMFGTIGYPLYQYEIGTPFIRVFIAFFTPIFFVKLVSIIWKKYLSNEFAYEIPKVKVDNQVKTLTRVDEDGGMVLADTSDIERAQEQLHWVGSIKMQAKTLPGIVLNRGQPAYVIAIESNGTLIIDTWPKASNK